MDIFTINASNLFSRILTNITLTILVLFGFIFTSFAQYSTSIDTLNCVGGTTTFVVDLSSNPDSTWVSQPQTRAGDCCGTESNCVQFALTLAPGATGINFFIPDGCGASPSGSLFYQVDCGPLTSVGEPICLNGLGPFILTFCKPGNNDNCYSIQSIPTPSTSGNVITADGCTDTLAVTGLITDSITWNSIFPGVPGEYNGLLSDLSSSDFGVNGISFEGHDIVLVTPGIGSPSTIQYEVCGAVTGFCISETWCDTVSVNIFPMLYADIQPNNPTICFGGLAETITAHPIGGTGPYSYSWSTLVDPAIDGATTQSIDVLISGEYTVIISDATDCPFGYDTVYVNEYTNTITVNAGLDLTICGSPVPTISLNGSSPITGSAIWTNYTGVFSTSDVDTISNYTPSSSEISAGIIELYLVSTNNYTCLGDSDTILINLSQFEANLTIIQNNISCQGADDGSIDLTVNGGSSPFSFDWSNSSINEDLVALTSGTYDVLVTDVNGCVDSLETTILEPLVFEIVDTNYTNYNGYNISCFGRNDGSIDLTFSGGTEPYTYVWSTLDGSGFIVNDEDQTALTVGTYTITATDANGCQIIQSYTLSEPTELTESTTVVVYPSGDNISCNGLADGSIDLTITNGLPAYTYTWASADGSGLVINDEDQTGLTAGTYDVKITDVNNCAISTSITLIEPAVLTESTTVFEYPSGDNISCNGIADGSIDLTNTSGSIGYTCTWSTVDGSGLVINDEDQTGLTAGTYDVTTTDVNGCTISSSFTLVEPTVLTESIAAFVYPSGYNISCNSLADGSIDLTNTNGSPVYTYAWTTLDGSGLVVSDEDQTGLTAGTYNLTTTDVNGCMISSSISLIEPKVLTELTTAFVYPSGNNISCNGLADGSIDLTNTDGSPVYTYAWTTVDGSGLLVSDEDQTGLTAGTYDVTTTDLNGCTISSSITLIEPTALTETITAFQYPSGDNISCNGLADGTIDLTTANGSPVYTYSWSTNDGSGLIIGDEDQTGLTAGTYDVNTTDINGCTIMSTIVLNEPAILTSNITVLSDYYGQPISCSGQSDGQIQVTANGGSPSYTYEWETNPVQTTDFIEGLGEGVYTATISDTNLCTIIVSTILTANPLPVLTPDPSITVCEGETVTFNSNSDENEMCSWSLSNGMEFDMCGANTIFITDPGCYDATLTVSTQAGCMNSLVLSDYICITANPEVNFSTNPNEVTIHNNTVQFENESVGASNYEWEFGDGNFSNQENPIHDFPNSEPGEYNVTLYAYNENGCMNTINKVITVWDRLLFYVPNTFTPDGNEFNESFNPVFGSGYSPKDYNLLVFNRWGEILFESNDLNIGWDGTYKGLYVPEGTYSWKMMLRKSKNTLEATSENSYHGHVNVLR